jgi:hypothetical protein
MVFARTPLGDPAADAARFLRRIALALLFIVTPVAEAASHGLIYVLFPIGAVIVVIAGLLAETAAAPRRFVAAFLNPIAIAAIFLVFWAGLSLIWTAFPGEAAARLARTLMTAGIALLAIIALPERTKISNVYLLPIGVGLTAAVTFGLSLFGPDWFREGPNPDYLLAQRCVMSLAILMWPAIAALALRERYVMATALATLVAAATLAAFIQAALAAFMVAAVVYVVAMTNPIGMARFMAIVCAILLLGAPIFVALLIPAASHLHIAVNGPLAVFGNLTIHEWPRFITGHGLDAVEHAIDVGLLPHDAPHSLIFMLWYELGIVGVAGFAVLLIAVLRAVADMPPYAAPAFLGSLAAGLVIAFAGTETTQLWWMTLNAIGAVGIAILIQAHPRSRRPPAPTFTEDDDDEDRLVEVYQGPDF